MTRMQALEWLLFGMAFVSMLGGFAFVLFGLPPEAGQGYVQKIFFFHVPSAFMMYAGLLLGAGGSAFYLYEKKPVYDCVAEAGMTMATFFATIVIVSGPLWAKPIWGVYWTWDPRLTTTLVLYILLLAYHSIRRIYREPATQSKARAFSAIVAILTLIDAPLIHFSVKLWRGIHPTVLRNPDGLPESYRSALELMIIAFMLTASVIFLMLFRICKLKHRIDSTQIGDRHG